MSGAPPPVGPGSVWRGKRSRRLAVVLDPDSPSSRWPGLRVHRLGDLETAEVFSVALGSLASCWSRLA